MFFGQGASKREGMRLSLRNHNQTILQCDRPKTAQKWEKAVAMTPVFNFGRITKWYQLVDFTP